MTIEEAFVRKCRNISAGRFREICDDIETIKRVRAVRQEAGNAGLVGRIGSYHHL